MWPSLTLFAFFLLIIPKACQAAKEPINQDNINICSDGCHPHDCSDVYAQGLKTDGVYLIYPGGIPTPIPVYCDMTGTDGPWTVFQKRFDGKVDFYRGWKEYKAGFGRADGEYWLGLQNIHLLTLKKTYYLRIDLVDWDNKTRYATYENFSISRLAIDPEEDGYKLYFEGFTEGYPNRPAGMENTLLCSNENQCFTTSVRLSIYLSCDCNVQISLDSADNSSHCFVLFLSWPLLFSVLWCHIEQIAFIHFF
ncbi:microfibril-associated glycoprotein 4-like [Pyxicephalus adspersus]|uniref:microfibril-associated glycoprotein 4-like n=1 Tax=Pyxicephalus adspersus TaxID=30357 RepID=UPI003B5AC938